MRALREEMVRLKLDGFVLPRGANLGSSANRLAWLTGFQGSSGTAVVLADQAAIFVDERYVLQIGQQVDGRLWSYQSVPQTSVAEWLLERAAPGFRIGYDAWLHTKNWVRAVQATLAEREVTLVPVDNPMDRVWTDRPRPPSAPIAVHPLALAGKTSEEKRLAVAEWLVSIRVDAVALAAPDAIAWAFNVRGHDVDHTPVVVAFALICGDGSADLFVAPDKLSATVKEHLGPTVRVHSPDDFADHVQGLSSRRIAVDPEHTVSGIVARLEGAGATVVEARDPTLLPRAIKNATEIAGHKAAQARDGAALSRFLHWLSVEAPKGGVSEVSAAAQLHRFRSVALRFRDLSFPTISAAGPSGAIPHYHLTTESSRPIESGTLYLTDSGGQYLDGTTDVTRTVAIGRPTTEMRERFTRVLKGHIALASVVFPAGTCGGQLDLLARQYLWAAGLDYRHGTGHGVGSFLSVHEGPQAITNPRVLGSGGDEPLVPGMILSNEPAYYKPGEYGIRIENLMVVTRRGIPSAEHEMLGFEVLTVVPIDRAMIDTTMLSPEERGWIDTYHREVARIVGPELDGPAKRWLMEATRHLD